MKISRLFPLIVCVVLLLGIEAEAQIMPTGMRITVISRLGNPAKNAKVTIYANKKDYEKEENAIAGPVFTDAKGRVTIKNLEAKAYYVQVVKGDENNYGDAEQTGVLRKGRINKFNIVIQ